LCGDSYKTFLCAKRSVSLSGITPRSPQKAPTKQRATIRLSRDVLERFRATGRGWQTRMDAALREWLENHPAE
jgi:uncharacterized protein (DUF4415 family)